MHPVLDYVARRVSGRTGTQDAVQVSPVSADDALEALPPDLKARLGALVDAPQEAAELAIALLPYGYRVLLAGYGLIEMTVSGGNGGEDEANSPRRRIQLLDFGRHIINACADPPAPVGRVSELDSEATKLRERYEPDLPFETEESAG